jgi:hypothetical protein
MAVWPGYDGGRQSALAAQTDLTPARWIEPLLVPGSFEVRMTVPRGFGAYARIFFPFDDDGLSWADAAGRNGRRAHALMERETIAWNDAAARRHWSDRLSKGQFDALLGILSRQTSSADGWFLAWNGPGDLTVTAPLLSLPMGRDLYLLHGPIEAYADFPDPPSYWWPDDRAWCVAGDVDFEWCYLAGTAACVSEVLAVPVIDAYETSPANPARSGMDLVNDPDGVVPRSM